MQTTTTLTTTTATTSSSNATVGGGGLSDTSTNLTASSTPIRIGSAKSHGHAAGRSGGAGDSTSIGSGATTPHQSSSVPTVTGSHLQLQTPALSTGASNQSLGVSVGAAGNNVTGISITPPNSAGLRQTGVFDFKLKRRPSLKVRLTKRPSSDSLSNSPVPSSPGLANWATDNRDGNLTADKSSSDASKLNRKESYKAQRKNYRREKKRVTSEMMNSLQDPTVIVLADWLKVRGTLKSWTKLWCVLKPGLLLIYKSPKTKSSHWVGTVMLTSCQVIERPSKKDGFCFKLFHPLEQSIWAPRGPDKETIGAVVQPLPTAYLIFRAPSQAAGKCWMDALELSLRCSALLLRSNSSTGHVPSSNFATDSAQISHETQWSEADYEKHFNDHDLDADSQNEGPNPTLSGPDSDSESDAAETIQQQVVANDVEEETLYIQAEEEDFAVQQGEQIEELAEENKSLIWILVKQVRPGMDLSKVVLPTFILEPRSFLEKLGDSYFHADILSKAVLEDDPLTRMKLIIQWYLSGFYKKPKGLKKPYNPILGESFRCYWLHPNGSRTYYIAEQVSHHPPISAFYVTNRQEGFSISCSILAKSKFYGNSTSAVLDGVAKMTLLPRGETYTLTTPYAHCKGILMGTLSMELGGKVFIECENTGYKTELEFKLKPFLGGTDNTNVVAGKIKLGKETMCVINGHWDTEMFIRDSKTGEETLLLSTIGDLRKQRLKRYVVPIDSQLPHESERLWYNVSEAIRREDQVAATEEKTILEERQRNEAKTRLSMGTLWDTRYFDLDVITGQWMYKYADLRPWDPRNDVKQYEYDYKVLTKTRHQATPIVRTSSMVSHSDVMHAMRSEHARQSKVSLIKSPRINTKTAQRESDSSQSPEDIRASNDVTHKSVRQLMLALDHVNAALEKQTRQLNEISERLERLQYAPPPSNVNSYYVPRSMQAHSYSSIAGVGSITHTPIMKALLYAFIGLFICLLIRWIFK